MISKAMPNANPAVNFLPSSHENAFCLHATRNVDGGTQQNEKNRCLFGHDITSQPAENTEHRGKIGAQ